MTVGYLKEQLANYPDDARIVVDGGPLDKVDISQHEIISLITWVKKPEMIVMQTRDDFDFMNELAYMIRHFRDEKQTSNWKEIVLNAGYTEEEIKEVVEYLNTHDFSEE